HEPRCDEREARRRCVEHAEEDPVEEQPAAEVVGDEEDEHRRAPDHEQRAPVLQAALREHLALLAEIGGEEDDQRDLSQLAGLEAERAEVHPESRAIHAQADSRQERHEEEPDRAETEEVLVVLQEPVIAAQSEQGEREHDDADHDEVEELAIAVAQPQRSSPQTSSAAATPSSATIARARRTRAAGEIGSFRVTAAAAAEPGSTNTCSTSEGGTTIVSTAGAGERTPSSVSSSGSAAGM